MQFTNITLNLFNAKVIKGVGKESGKSYQAVVGKIFPMASGRSPFFFFEASPSGLRTKAEVCEKPFPQGSTLKVELNAAGELVKVEVIEAGVGPAAIYVFEKKQEGAAKPAPVGEARVQQELEVEGA